MIFLLFFPTLKDTHWENTPSNKNQGLAKNINIDIWVFSIFGYFASIETYKRRVLYKTLGTIF